MQFTKNENWDIPSTKVFISIGEFEGPTMVSTMIKFSSYLESRNYENIDLNRKIFDNETHFSVIPVMWSQTLSILYGIK